MAKTKQLNEMKIALAGSGGSGKSSIMRDWSINTNTPIIQVETKSYMPEGVNTHLDIVKMSSSNPTAGIEFQSKLIKLRSEAFKNSTTGFISDRSVMDSFAYYSVHNSMFSSAETDSELWMDTVYGTLACDLTVFIKPQLTKFGYVPSNGIRIESLPYYEVISSTIREGLHGIIFIDGIIDSAKLSITEDVDVTVFVGNNTSIAMLNEDNTETGFSSTEIRLKSIKQTCDFINFIRSK